VVPKVWRWRRVQLVILAQFSMILPVAYSVQRCGDLLPWSGSVGWPERTARCTRRPVTRAAHVTQTPRQRMELAYWLDARIWLLQRVHNVEPGARCGRWPIAVAQQRHYNWHSEWCREPILRGVSHTSSAGGIRPEATVGKPARLGGQWRPDVPARRPAECRVWVAGPETGTAAASLRYAARSGVLPQQFRVAWSWVILS
jgi:hypothetical protein